MTKEYNIYLTGKRETVAGQLANLRAQIDGVLHDVQSHQEDEVRVTVGNDGATVSKFEASEQVPINVEF